MNIVCGVDIIYIPKIKELLADENVIKKFFDPTELDRTTPEHLAGMIAAKEAFFKAIGQVPKFREVKIVYEKSGRPMLIVAPQLKKFISCDLSISHDKDYAVAFVVLER